MTTAITKWGNSHGIRIPKAFLDSLNLKDCDTIELSIEDDTLLMKKVLLPARRSRSIQQRFEEFYGTDFDTALKENPYEFPEVDWGPPVGDEAW